MQIQEGLNLEHNSFEARSRPKTGDWTHTQKRKLCNQNWLVIAHIQKGLELERTAWSQVQARFLGQIERQTDRHTHRTGYGVAPQLKKQQLILLKSFFAPRWEVVEKLSNNNFSQLPNDSLNYLFYLSRCTSIIELNTTLKHPYVLKWSLTPNSVIHIHVCLT